MALGGESKPVLSTMSDVVQGAKFPRYHSLHDANKPTEQATILPLLSRALSQIRSSPPRVIASPATRASPIRISFH